MLTKISYEESEMATIPHSMLMAKSRAKNNSKQAKQSKSQDYNFYSPEMMQPAKYSTKMMNSIWGMYNKYSVHNLKAVQGDDKQTVGMQQLPNLNDQNYYASIPTENNQQSFASDISGNLQFDGLGASVSNMLPEGLSYN